VAGPIWNSLAYHGLPESHMKTAGAVPKYNYAQLLSRVSDWGEKHWRKAC